MATKEPKPTEPTHGRMITIGLSVEQMVMFERKLKAENIGENTGQPVVTLTNLIQRAINSYLIPE